MVSRFGAGTLKKIETIPTGRFGRGVPVSSIREAQQPAIIQGKVSSTIQQIKSGQITSASQIPSEVKQYITVPEGYFEYQQQQKEMTEGITSAENKLKYYQQQLENARRSNDPRLQDKYIEYVNAWSNAVGYVKQGYTYDSASKWANQTASGEIALDM